MPYFFYTLLYTIANTHLAPFLFIFHLLYKIRWSAAAITNCPHRDHWGFISSHLLFLCTYTRAHACDYMFMCVAGLFGCKDAVTLTLFSVKILQFECFCVLARPTPTNTDHSSKSKSLSAVVKPAPLYTAVVTLTVIWIIWIHHSEMIKLCQ